MSLKIGLTGGIGSGKTVVSDAFAALGAPVIDTDVIAREVVRPGQPALEEIRAEFGKQVLSADGGLDRDALRRRVFQDEAALARLEAITHPRIGERTRRLVSEVQYPYCIVVVPLLTTSALRGWVDRILVVEADRARRIEWVAERSKLTPGEVEDIMRAQASDAERRAIADDLIHNDSDLDALRAKVAVWHRRYLRLARQAED